MGAQLWPEGLRDWQQSETVCYTARVSLRTERGSLLHRQVSARQTCLSIQREALCYTVRVRQSKHVSQNRARLSVTPPGFSKANMSLKTEGGSLLRRQDSVKQIRLSSRARLSATPPRFSKANMSLKTERGSLLHCQGSAKHTYPSKQRKALCYTTKIQ